MLVSSAFAILFLCTEIVQVSADRCDRTKIGNEYYKRQLIATIDGYPTGITIDPRTEDIFFMLHKKNYTKGRIFYFYSMFSNFKFLNLCSISSAIYISSALARSLSLSQDKC